MRQKKEEASLLEDGSLWYKDALIYQLHVKAFYDRNNDGIGDFLGLTEKIDYLHDLGINAVWLMPFYPSPMRDDGYDIADYRIIHPDYGTRQDFRAFIKAAHRRDIRVITELVINHTSDQHPWFQAARRAPPKSVKRNYYVWSDTDKKWPETRIIFNDTETSNWAWDPMARAYYWHRFFSHQPDLNFNNPHVVKAVIRTMRFWLDLGVDGLRLDAIPYLCERDRTNNENLPETHAVIKEMRAVVDAHYHSRMFLAEANQWPEDVCDYFGGRDECHMAYHFPLMPRMYMALAQSDRHPITEIMNQTPDIPEICQWAIFLRNHDELTLEMVTDRERDYMYQVYATDPRMRLNLGIRRRLAPLLDNDMDKIKLMKSLLLSMPGSPILYYGDEIGMGDNFFLGDRNGVRTPMQWSPDRNAGFSKADPQRLYLPPIMDPVYGFEAVNVEAQRRDPSSLLNWMRRMLAVRKAHKVFGRGSLQFIYPGNRKILAYIRETEQKTVLCVANLDRSAQPVELDLSRYKGRVPVEMMGRTAFPPIGDLPYLLTLPGYGFYWFHLTQEAEAPPWHKEVLLSAELPVLVLFEGWRSFFPEEVEHTRRPMAERLRRQMEREVLPGFLAAQRWFAAKGERIDRVELLESAEWMWDKGNWLLARVRVHLDDSEAQTYFLPLTIAWEKAGEEERIRQMAACTLAKIRQRARVGVLCDALADLSFCQALMEALRQGIQIPFGRGCFKFSTTAAFSKLVGEAPLEEIRSPVMAGSNTAVILGNRLFLKIYRHLQEGRSSEIEMGYFLTEVSPFAHIVPLAGALEYQDGEGNRIDLGLLQSYVPNQGDAWSNALNYVKQFLETARLKPLDEIVAQAEELHAVPLMMIRTLGWRTGELHQALARQTGDPAFDPEPISLEDLSAWCGQIRDEAMRTLDLVQRHQAALSASLGAEVKRLLALRTAITDRLSDLTPLDLKAFKTRHHGDFHLGQVLLVENDFIIVDFEGEPARPLHERRAKHSPLRDVAGMLRSFDYAASVAVQHCIAECPEDKTLLDTLAHNLVRLATEAFLAGYREGIEGCPSYPANPDHADRLIQLFTLEKALYELRYELASRPDWVRVPLAGLLRLLGAEEAS